MDANLTQIRAFLTVARLKNFTQAARILNISQPALTIQVKQLEEVLNLKLLDRNTRHVALTRVGQELVPTFQRLLLEFDAVIRSAQGMSSFEQGTIRFGCIPSFASLFLPEVIAAYKKQHPLVSFVMRDATGKNIISMVRNGEIEFGITDGPPSWPDLKVTELYDDPIHLVSLKSHPISKLKSITIEEIARWPLILLENASNTRTVVETAFSNSGMLVTPVCEVSNGSSAIGLVRAGIGISLLGSLVVRSNNPRALSGILSRPIDDPTFVRHIGVVWLARQSLSSPATAFVDVLNEYFRNKAASLTF